ncbi:MAG: FAD-dependent oxidoreductase [Anaerolineaceae bacterium]|nr:FAD-dependent oxidoreductase [Anaerolineaceae bacterium]
MEKADFVIIGSGQGGVPLAERLAEDGRKVVLFERAEWGGTCTNTGCIPSKTLLASAHAATAARRAARLGIQTEVQVDFPAVMARVRQSIKPQMVADGLESSGVQLVHGEAALVGDRTVASNGRTVAAETIIINTGKSPLVPPIPGLADTPFLTYQNFWNLQTRPNKLIVLGGGYTGLELAQAMQRLGSQVHVVEKEDRLVADEEPDVSQALQQALEADGVCFHLSSTVSKVEHVNRLFLLSVNTLVDPLIGNALLVATGRRPNVNALAARERGIQLDDKNHIQVDDQFRTSADGVYAIGDVTGQPAFTHVSREDHRRLLAVLRGNGRHQNDRVLAYAFFTEPQVGRVGRTLAQAQEQGLPARAETVPLSESTRAFNTGHDNGFYRLVINTKTDQILGATLVGPQSAELVHIILALMEAGATWQVLARSQNVHPAYAELLPALARKFASD